MNSQRLGGIIVVASIILLALLFTFKIGTDNRNLASCEKICGENSGSSCTIAECPFHQAKNNSWIIILMGVLTSFIGGIGTYIFFNKKEVIIEQKEYDLTSLSEEEKNLFLFIRDNPETFQSSLVERFNLSKVQATRILDRLEQKGLIERKRRGMTNLLVVK